MTRKSKKSPVYTLADARDERARADARMMVRERKAAIADAQRRATRAAARYAEFGGSVHRLTRMRTARRLRELMAAPI